MRLVRINTPDELLLAAQNKRAVVVANIGYMGPRGYQPAAWIANMSFQVVMRMLNDGIFLYEPKAITEKSARGEGGGNRAEASS